MYDLSRCRLIEVGSIGGNAASNYQHLDCMLNSFLRQTTNKLSKLRIIGPLCEENHRPPVDSHHKRPVMRVVFPCYDFSWFSDITATNRTLVNPVACYLRLRNMSPRSCLTNIQPRSVIHGKCAAPLTGIIPGFGNASMVHILAARVATNPAPNHWAVILLYYRG